MSKGTLLLLVLLLASCEVFQDRKSIPRTRLSDREFVAVYVELARATQPAEKQRILKQHGTSQRELEQFVRAYSRDLSALSMVFDTIVARLNARDLEDLPGPQRP